MLFVLDADWLVLREREETITFTSANGFGLEANCLQFVGSLSAICHGLSGFQRGCLPYLSQYDVKLEMVSFSKLEKK